MQCVDLALIVRLREPIVWMSQKRPRSVLTTRDMLSQRRDI
jgi:hypothetical protein